MKMIGVDLFLLWEDLIVRAISMYKIEFDNGFPFYFEVICQKKSFLPNGNFFLSPRNLYSSYNTSLMILPFSKADIFFC